MIITFASKDTERLWAGRGSKKLPPDVQKRALIKLALIDAADGLDDLKNPPGNRLHTLSGDRVGQHSISINMQWRICFVWNDGEVQGVEIVDYH